MVGTRKATIRLHSPFAKEVLDVDLAKTGAKAVKSQAFRQPGRLILNSRSWVISK
jgi:hypothetical protein